MSYKGIFSCRNKIAIVTGGAGLIGREVVKGLRDNGAKVYIADKDELSAKKIAKHINIKYIYLDITSEESIGEAFKEIKESGGRIDILVNTAYPRTKDWRYKLEKVSFESWKTNVNTQLGGYFLCCRIAAEYMKAQKGGSIINFGSTYGVIGPDFSIYEGTDMTMPAAYSAIKGGVINFTRYMATYYAKYKIRINAVSPGGIFDNQPQTFVEKYSRKTPLGRMACASEMVGAVVFLASDASSYVTGHNLMVDGGWTAW